MILRMKNPISVNLYGDLFKDKTVADAVLLNADEAAGPGLALIFSDGQFVTMRGMRGGLSERFAPDADPVPILDLSFMGVIEYEDGLPDNGAVNFVVPDDDGVHILLGIHRELRPTDIGLPAATADNRLTQIKGRTLSRVSQINRRDSAANRNITGLLLYFKDDSYIILECEEKMMSVKESN